MMGDEKYPQTFMPQIVFEPITVKSKATSNTLTQWPAESIYI
jgi:hypothetical protein